MVPAHQAIESDVPEANCCLDPRGQGSNVRYRFHQKYVARIFDPTARFLTLQACTILAGKVLRADAVFYSVYRRKRMTKQEYQSRIRQIPWRDKGMHVDARCGQR